MVSMSKPQGVSQAQGYLAKENYYQKNSEIGKFYGKGLEYLGIDIGTEVTPEMYNHLLKGYDPITGKALHPNSGKDDRRAGMDVTFSAPKSVSILMENYEGIGENSKADLLRNAHDLAVQNAMKKLEEKYAKTRVYSSDGNRIKVGAKLMYATFQHDTSREVAGDIDPQLHSHNFIFTTVFYKDEKNGEVRNLALSNEEIYQNKMYLGQLYRSELASNMAELGYKIEVTERKNGFFELEGLSENQLKEFSGRSEMVREKLSEYREKYPKMSENELLQLIVTDTKNAKKEIDREAVREQNLERMAAVGIDKSLIHSMENRGQKAPINEVLMQEHIEKSLDNIMQKQSLFTSEDLSKMVLKYGLEYGYNESDYMPLIVKNNQIIAFEKNIFSTQKMIDAEKNIIKSIHKSRDKFDNFEDYKSDNVRLFLEKNYPTMTDEQVQMVRFILGNKDEFVAIQGDAGTGKTFAARAVKEYLETYHESQEIIGLSFTGKATQGLESDTDIKSNTVHSFLAREAKLEGNEPKNRLIIVDEAGMIGSLQMNELIENAKKNGDRLVFMGDTKQFKSISAGNIFKDMQKWGTKTIKLSQALRQESDLAIEAVTSLKEQMVKKSLSIIEEKGTFKEYSRDESVKEISSNYANLESKKQDDTLIITSTNKDKEAINWAIRSKLGKGGAVYRVQSYASVNGIAAHYSQGYEVGQKIAITGTIEGFSNKEKLIITGIKDDKTITVKSGGKKSQEKHINVYEHGNKLQVFKEVEKPFAKGDVIIFTKNTVLEKGTRSSVKNGERTRIKSINKHGDIITKEGKKFNIHKMPYVDHGYAITDVKSQGTTVKNVVVMAQSDMANFNSFYTQITRAKKNITLYTDNKEQLAANVQKTSNTKSTLDYTIKRRELKKELNNSTEREAIKPKEKKKYENIKTSKEIESTSTNQNKKVHLKKVGVHQTNLESEMKIDIYRNSIGKLDGVSEKTTTPHKKFRGIEVTKKTEKEQTHDNRGADTSTLKENSLKDRGPRERVQDIQRAKDGRNRERIETKQNGDDRSFQNNDSHTGLFEKIKATIFKKPKNRRQNDGRASSIRETINSKNAHHKRSEITRRLARIGTLQSNLESTQGQTLRKSKHGVHGLSSEYLVRDKFHPKMLLQTDVSNHVGRGEGSNKSMRRQGDSYRHDDGRQINIKASFKEFMKQHKGRDVEMMEKGSEKFSQKREKKHSSETVKEFFRSQQKEKEHDRGR